LNYFGHAVIAAAANRDPEFVLGATLPDLSSMLRIRVRPTFSGELLAGVRFHHDTDRAFHDSRAFRGLQRTSFGKLLGLGVRRSTARAVAHVGIELLLDAAMAHRIAGEQFGLPLWHAGDHYRLAMQRGSLLETWATHHDQREAAQLVALCTLLERAGAEAFRVTPREAMELLERILARRPRLAVAEADSVLIRRWAGEAFSDTESALPQLLEELEKALGLPLS
jgi:hypothetical protein